MIIYTCITNGYDEISDSHYYDPDVQYVCFTDGTIEQKGPWEFREIPIEHECPLRRALYPKIMQHKVFPMGEQVVWVDGCYKHTKEWVEFSKKQFPRTHIVHPCKFSYYEEVIESFISSYNSLEDIVEITETVKSYGFDFKQYVNPIMATFWNTVSEEAVEFNELWWKLSQISTRCDQIAFVTAKYVTGLHWNTIDDWLEPGIDMSGVAGTGRVGRKKLHPMPGRKDQWKDIDSMLKTIKPIVGLHPHFYNKFWKRENKVQEWIDHHS